MLDVIGLGEICIDWVAFVDRFPEPRESYAPFTTLFDIAALAVLDSVAAEVMVRKGLDEQHILKRHATLE